MKDKNKEERKEIWLYKPDNLWFENLEDAKIYLGNSSKVDKAIENKDLVRLTYTNIINLDIQSDED